MQYYKDLLEHINRHDFSYYTGVPDSLLSGVFQEYKVHIATNEFIAYCMALGAQLAGKRSAVFLQNSGFFYTIPAINGISSMYDEYPFLYITKPHGHSHTQNNLTVDSVLESVIKKNHYLILEDSSDYPGLTSEVCKPTLMQIPGQLIESRYSALLDEIRNFDEALIVASAGYLNGLVEEQLSQQFTALYLRGGMGGSIPVGVGLAQNTDKDIIVITGDGATLMHYTALSNVYDLNLPNLHIYIIVNGVLESTGGQKIPAFPLIDIPNVKYLLVNEEIPVVVKKGMTVYDYQELKEKIRDFCTK